MSCRGHPALSGGPKKSGRGASRDLVEVAIVEYAHRFDRLGARVPGGE
jgi:hypothetical protein